MAIARCTPSLWLSDKPYLLKRFTYSSVVAKILFKVTLVGVRVSNLTHLGVAFFEDYVHFVNAAEVFGFHFCLRSYRLILSDCCSLLLEEI